MSSKLTAKRLFSVSKAWFALLFLLNCGFSAGLQEPAELGPNARVDRSLSGGQTHEYRLNLSAGEFLYAVVEQKGIDVEVVLLGPDGKKIAHVDSLNSAWGPEPMVAIAGVAGEYRLQVVAGNPQASPGEYQIRVEALRSPTDQDVQHVKVNREVEQAQDLLAKGDNPSLQSSLEKFKSAVVFYHSAGLQYDEALALYSLGNIQGQLRDFRGALQFDQQAMTLFQSIHDLPMEGNTMLNMGGAYDVMGDLTRALEAYHQAIQLIKSKGDRLSEAEALNDIGKIHADMAEWQEAREYYQQALQIFHEIGDRAREATALSNLGNAGMNLAESSKAQAYFQQALKLFRAAGDKRGEAAIVLQLGTVSREEGQLSNALKLYEEATVLSRSAGDHWREGKALLLLGSALVANGEPQKALEQLQQSLKLLQAAEDRRNEGVALRSLGQTYAALHQPEQALASYNQALTILQAVGDRNYSAQALMGIAQVERDQNKLGDSRKHAEEALALVEQVRSKAGAQEDRASYFATQQGMGEFYIDLLMRMHQQDPSAGHDAEAFEATERERARSLLEMLAEARVDIRQGVDPKLLQREHEIAGLLNSNAQRLLTLRGAGTETKAADLKKEISSLESESQQIELAIRKSSPQYSAMTQPQPLTLKQIQQQVLDSDTVLLEYALGDERSYLWAVSANGLKSYELPRRSEIEKSVREVVELLSARATYVRGELPQQKKDRIAQADAQLPPAAARLSQMVLAPAAAELGNKRLVLVTDGSLQHVPFAMLPVPGANSATASPLVAEHEIVSLPSASTVAELRKEIAGRAPAPKTIAVLADPVFEADDPRVKTKPVIATQPAKTQPAKVGPPKTEPAKIEPAKVETAKAEPVKATTTADTTEDDNSRILVHLAAKDAAKADVTNNEQLEVPRLPFTRQEADRIIKLAGEKDSLEALDFRASLATATSPELSQYRYLHFATHGYLDSEQPELSAIVLALVDKNGKPQTGFLRANDIYNLKLPADLVVLSACQTGLGKEIRGEGIVGLTRGFMYAGVPRVIVSLWSVNDRATEELMASFYQKLLKEKLSPAAALRQAQISMLTGKNKQWSSPYYWAAFVQQGEWK